ncbi:helix-turn-helix domain-containing protein [Gorillibacterium sp. sgz5001074]|uniref:helix-turn-helix domain-containing protein n=1 Tax=Gorillibacterium sp. sgz5001074 TaxID=3446695 RepID=UPI003F6787F6
MRRSSYLLKLVILTLMVGTFPVLILGWYSYHYSSQSVLKQMEEGNAQVLRQSQLRVEQTLKMIDYSTSQVLSVPAVSKAIPLRLGTGETAVIQELYNILASIQTYELGIKDVYLFSLQQDWLITNGGMEEYSQPGLKEKLRSYASNLQGSFWTAAERAKLPGSEGMVELEHAVMSVKKWPINSANPRGMICVVVSASQLKQLIDSDPLPGGTTFILDGSNRVIAHSDDTKLGTDLSGTSYIQTIRARQDLSGVLKDKEGKEAVSISFRKSSYNGWTYVSVVPTQAITREATAIGWTSILVSIGVLAATVVVSLIGSRRMYSPVRRISRVLLDEKDAGQRKDEFVAIADRIEGILSDQTKLRFELEGQQKQLVELLERKLLLGEVKGKEIRERLHYYGFGHTEQWEKMRVMLLQIDRLETGRFSEKDRDLLLFAVSNIAAELVPEGGRLPPIVIQESVAVLIGTRAQSEEAFKEAVYGMAVKVQSSVKSYLELQTSIGISRPFSDWAEAGRGYEEGENALKYRARLGEEAVLFIEDVQPHQSKDIVYPKELSDELLEAINNLDTERARTALTVMMESLSKQDYDHNDYQLSLVRLLMELVRLLQDAGISLHTLEVGEGSLFEELLKLHTGREIEAWFGEHIVEPGIRLLEERRQAQFSSISQEVKRLIEEAFDTDLTLEKCSARINYHPQYISRVFRQETGINFADYLAQYRLEVAKKWLKETDLTITDIAEKLKYNNPANFIRYFRKMEGMTPGQFRDKIK